MYKKYLYKAKADLVKFQDQRYSPDERGRYVHMSAQRGANMPRGRQAQAKS